MNIHVNGQETGEEQAFKAAAKILSNASLPLIAGLGTDIAGAKAALTLAAKTGGVVDHLASDGLMREMRLQSYTGGFTTTAGEARNRADLILVVGKTPLVREPDLVKRLFPTGERLPHPGEEPRKLILLTGRCEQVPSGVTVTQIDGTNSNMEISLGCLSAYVKDMPVSADKIGEANAAALKATAEKLQAAKFPIIVFAPDELSEPAMHCIRDLVVTLNVDERASSIAISGRDNATGVNQVCGWRTGHPLRTSFARGGPDHDPYLYETNRLLTSGEVDALLWITSLTKTPPPTTAANIPQIVLSVPGTQFSKTPDILIEIGEPGADHDAALFRPEYGAIVATKAKVNPPAGLFSAADALNKILQQISDSGEA